MPKKPAEPTKPAARAKKPAENAKPASSPAPAETAAAPVARPARPLDNKQIAAIFYETGDLMEIDNADPFRIRSYRRAAEALEALPQQISDIIAEPKRVL